MKDKIIKFLLFSLIINLILTIPVMAQGSTPSADDVNAIAKNMYCPVCENTPLDQCDTAACQQWRDEIRDKLSQGWTEDEIYDYFVKKFGDSVLAEPPKRGLNLLIYILPPIVILFGGLMLWRVVRDWIKPIGLENNKNLVNESNSSDKYTALLEEELKKRQ